MKSWQRLTLYLLSGLCLLTVLVLMVVSQANRSIQSGMLEQEVLINKGRINVQVGQTLIREIAQRAPKNPKFQELLKRYGTTPVPATASPPGPLPNP